MEKLSKHWMLGLVLVLGPACATEIEGKPRPPHEGEISFVTLYDSNGNGFPDVPDGFNWDGDAALEAKIVSQKDEDGDGIPEEVGIDLDGDGAADLTLTLADILANRGKKPMIPGLPDRPGGGGGADDPADCDLLGDSDGDGTPDTVNADCVDALGKKVCVVDSDGDGTADGIDAGCDGSTDATF